MERIRQSEPVPRPAAPARESESSELEEIQVMARMAKARIERRKRAQKVAEEALLRSSAAEVSVPRTLIRPEVVIPATPVAEPAAAERTWVWWGLGAVAAVAAGLAAVLALKGGPEETLSGPVGIVAKAPAAPVAPSSSAAAPSSSAVPPAPPQDAPPSAAAPPAVKAEVPQPVAAPVDKEKQPKKVAKAVPKKPKRVKEVRREKRPAVAMQAEPEPVRKAKPKKKDGLDDLFDDIKSDEPKAGAGSSDEEAVQPKKAKLARSDLARVMRRVSPKANACAKKHGASGTAIVKFTVKPDGRVTGAKTTGAHAGTPFGNCLASKVAGARFPAVTGRGTSFSFPFILSN